MSTTDPASPMKVLLHIRSLHIGGAERQVVSLAKSMTALGSEVHVAVIAGGGELERDLSSEPDIHVHTVGGPGILGKFKYLIRLRSLVKRYQFDAVYGFLPTPNMALLVATTIRKRPLIAWGVRSSGLDLSQYNRRVRWAMRLEKFLSRFPDRIITNSQAALDEYHLNKYPLSKLSHIPNAIDTERFRPDKDVRRAVRKDLDVPKNVPLIGIFARLHPMKDHLTFLEAVSILVKELPQARFIAVGGTSDEYANYAHLIRTRASELNLDNSVQWLGPRNDPERLMAACDVTVLSSDSGEGFPNAVAESMACGVPCVVTDVGDASVIVAGYTETVAPRAAVNLAEAIKRPINQDQANISETAVAIRQSIIDRYSTTAIAKTLLSTLSR